MESGTSKSRERDALKPYWRTVLICLVLLGIYLAIIYFLGTETAKRTTAPPWYSWVRYPPTRTRLQSLFLVFPAIVFAAWTGIVRRMVDRPMPGIFVMAISCAAVFAMNVTVAMMDGGPAAIAKPFAWGGSEYFGDVHWVGNVGEFLRGYVANMWHYSIHTRTHPPGAVLFLYGVKQLLGPGINAAAWVAVAITATAVVPFYLLARDLAGQRTAAIATSIYPVVPSLVLFGATSMDGVFLVPLIWATFFMRRTIARPSLGNAMATGIVLTISLMMSYVTVCIGLMMLIYAVLELHPNSKPFWRVAGAFAISGIVIAAFLWLIYLLSGFNYLQCFKASRYFDHYLMRTSHLSFGRYVDISFSNLMAFLIGMGLPVVVLWWKEMGRSDRFIRAGTMAIVAFSFAKLFTHETERIWLFFAPVAILAAASWIAKLGPERRRVLEWTLGLSFAQVWVFQLLLYTIW